MFATAIDLKEVRLEVTSMSPAFRSDRLSVKKVLKGLYRDARNGNVPYGFINELRRELKKIGFSM